MATTTATTQPNDCGGGGDVKMKTSSGEVVEEIGFVVDTQPYTSVIEGKAEVLFPASQDVFYNPVQEFNRDLSVAILRLFAMERKEEERERIKAKEKRKQKHDGTDLPSSQEHEGTKESISDRNKNGELNGSDRTIHTAVKNADEEKGKDTCETNDKGRSDTNRKKTNSDIEEIDKRTSSDDKGMKVDKEEEEEDRIIITGPTDANSSKGTQITDKIEMLIPGVKDEEGIRILEGLAASGLRSIRYAQEVGGVREVVANDISTQAVECMERNIKHNAVGHIVVPSCNDVSMVMYQNRTPDKRFHAIDLDPYGSPHQFLDGAVQSVAEGGVLLVTCTDMAVLCGNSPETCYAKYGALSLKTKGCHEMALRIVLQSLESHANRYSRYIVPLLSLSADFYVRVVVRVFTSKAKVQESFTKVSWVYQCVGCETTTLHPLGRILVNKKSIRRQVSQGPPVGDACEHCGRRHVVGGPVWSAPMHDQEFLGRLRKSVTDSEFATKRRMIGVLAMMEEELPDVPLYYVLDRVARVAGTNLCKMVHFRSALLNAGYRVSMSHAQPASLKTDAPASVVWDVARAWCKQQPPKKNPLPPEHTSHGILGKEIKTHINFDLHPDANPESRKNDLLRFQVNPERYWGPKSRAKTSLLQGTEQEKKARNQGKKRRQLSPQSVQTTKHPREQSPLNMTQQKEEEETEVQQKEEKKVM